MGLVALLRKRAKRALFTTPSHSQSTFLYSKLRNLYRLDISETEAHNPEEALACSEEYAARVYGTRYTKFLTNGSTSGIIAAVLACVKPGDGVFLWENSHISHRNAVRLAGGTAEFYEVPFDEEFGVSEAVLPDTIESKLKQKSIKAVIVTNPTYDGFVTDIRAIKKICEAYGAYLIVDEAHGALYPFSERLPESSVRIADFTVQSLHKTAGGLNPTALLHSCCDINPAEALALLNTTSPSYPILASIEANIKFLNSKRGKAKIEELINNILELRERCPNCIFGGDDVTKILVKVPGLSGEELSRVLFEKYYIEDERTSEKASMLLCGIGTPKKNLVKLGSVLSYLAK